MLETIDAREGEKTLAAVRELTTEVYRLDLKENKSQHDISELKDDVQQLQSDVSDLEENKANVSGEYPDLYAGNLISKDGANDSMPYNFRTTGGSVDVGDRKLVHAIVGGTLAWNQLYDKSFVTSNSTHGVTFTPQDNGTILVDGDPDGEADIYKNVIDQQSRVGHVLCLQGCPSGGGAGTYRLYMDGHSGSFDTGHGILFKQSADNKGVYIFINKNCPDIDNIIFTPQLYDLTLMFGPTIADWLYAVEQATAGNGVNLFRQIFPKDYYAYNAGQLMSVVPYDSETIGFNLFDPEASAAQVLKNVKVHVKGTYTGLTFDGAAVTLDGSGNFTPPKNGLLSVAGAENDVCINNVWDGSRNDEYEAYEEHHYALDHTKELRGILKQSADYKFYFDGERMLPEGKIQRRYGIVDLGTLEWTNDSSVSDGSVWYAAPQGAKGRYSSNGNTQVCSKYAQFSNSGNKAYNWKSGECRFGNNSTNLNVCDDALIGLTSEQVEAAMSGVYLVYELATPTEETCEPFEELQVVNDWGMERLTDYAYAHGDRDVEIPVGHETFYRSNPIAKIDAAPDSPSGDGVYAMQQSGGINVYVPLATVPLITAILERIPVNEESDGTYTLKSTVDGASVTYFWHLDE